METRSGLKVGSAAEAREQAQAIDTPPLPSAARPYFEEGVRLLFSRWTALVLAIENGWGGPSSKEKGQWLLQEATQWCYKTRGAYVCALWMDVGDELCAGWGSGVFPLVHENSAPPATTETHRALRGRAGGGAGRCPATGLQRGGRGQQSQRGV